METKYYIKRFGNNETLAWNDAVYVASPVRKIIIEALSNADTQKAIPYWNTQTNQLEEAKTTFWQPLPINFTLLQTDLTPEPSHGILFVGGDFETTTPYEYIFKTPKDFQGTYNFRLVQPELTSISNSAINQYSAIKSPKDNFYIGVKLTFYYDTI